MTTPLKTLAIQAALSNDWKTAQEINEHIINENPNDIDSLNRLGFSLMKQGKYPKAKDTFKKVITLDKTNPIALKNLKRLESVSKLGKNENTQKSFVLPTDIYIEEAGKTKTVELKNVADKKTLSRLEPGDTVSMVIKRSKIFVQGQDKKFIGMLPDNISTRLITFIKGGNEYSACIKAVDDKCVKVFIKEVKKAGKFKNQASFSNSYSSQLDS